MSPGSSWRFHGASVRFRQRLDSQVSDSQFALKGSRPSSLPAQGLVGLVQSPLRHFQKHGGGKTVPGEMKVLCLHDVGKQTFLQQNRCRVLFWGYTLLYLPSVSIF